MHEDVLAYAALHQARSAHAGAVHLHAYQLGEQVVASIRAGGVEVHAHAVNDDASLQLASMLALPWICTGSARLGFDLPQDTRHGAVNHDVPGDRIQSAYLVEWPPAAAHEHARALILGIVEKVPYLGRHVELPTK
jgi:hypothetical protein